MGLAEVFNTLGQEVIPKVAAVVFPDVLDILESPVSVGSGGGRIVGDPESAYYGVPCAYEPLPMVEKQDMVTGRFMVMQRYLITIPTHDIDLNSIRINLDPTKHRLRVHERGNEPEKIFRILTMRDHSGVVYEVICEREDVGAE